MRRKTPIDFFNVSFLDVITSTGGVFLFLVLIFFGALFFNTFFNANDKLSILWSRNISYQDSLSNIEHQIDLEFQKLDSLSSLNDTILSRLRTYQNNLPVYYTRDSLRKLEREIRLKKDSIKLLESIYVEIGEKIEGLTSEIPQVNKLSFLKPAFDFDTAFTSWSLIVLVKNDSIYLMDYTLDFKYFDWWTTDEERTKIGRPRKGTGIPIGAAFEEQSDFVRMIAQMRGRGVVLIELYDESINSYPRIRDYIVRNNVKMSLQFGSGEPEIQFSDDGWIPKPIY